MPSELQIPPPVPEIPRKTLWLTLLIPPLITLLSNMAIHLAWGQGLHDIEVIEIMTLVIFFLILHQLRRFNALVRQHYQSVTLFFLSWAYFLGQAVVCCTFFASACALLLPRPHP